MQRRPSSVENATAWPLVPSLLYARPCAVVHFYGFTQWSFFQTFEYENETATIFVKIVV